MNTQEQDDRLVGTILIVGVLAWILYTLQGCAPMRDPREPADYCTIGGEITYFSEDKSFAITGRTDCTGHDRRYKKGKL
jgi:hypothetical protein